MIFCLVGRGGVWLLRAQSMVRDSLIYGVEGYVLYAWGGSTVQTHRMYLLSCGDTLALQATSSSCAKCRYLIVGRAL